MAAAQRRERERGEIKVVCGISLKIVTYSSEAGRSNQSCPWKSKKKKTNQKFLTEGLFLFEVTDEERKKWRLF